MFKKILSIVLLSILVLPVASAYEEIDCTSDVVFETNSCNQCFDWGWKNQLDLIGLLRDDWINDSASSMILYKEEQKMPNMVNLNSSNVTWSQTPSTDGFWEYSSDFDALYSEDEEWYILESWNRVTWLESKMWYAFKLDANSAPANSNIGLLVYPISTHLMLDDGTPSIDDDEHKECVLFKSAAAATPVEPEEVERLPDTGPAEWILLWILAMILGFSIMRIKNKA